MAQTAAWPVDCVIPKVPVRQAVIWDNFAPVTGLMNRFRIVW
jgi:hypothetical protein